MQTERAELYFRQGSSDKVYHLQLETVDGHWCVQAQCGRRGSALQSDTKVSDAAYEEAKHVLRVCETAMTPKAKRDFLKRMHAINAEGFVCKNRNAPYAGGRAGQHYKCKFVVTASFIVGAKPEKKANDGRRSKALYLLDGNHQRFMGTVGVPDRYRLPKEGEIVEVQYFP